MQKFGYNVRGLNCNSGNIHRQGRGACRPAVLGGIEGRGDVARRVQGLVASGGWPWWGDSCLRGELLVGGHGGPVWRETGMSV